MKLLPTTLPGVVVIETQTRRDDRGEFVRVFCNQALAPLRADLRFVQANVSRTRYVGTVRGMHFQQGQAAEAKLIRCLRGRVFDVAVDLRADSPTYLQWFGLELDAARDQQVWIPEGCAHGFQALTDDVELLYQHTAPYTPALEAGVRSDDPLLAIKWPLPPQHLSDRDQSFAPLAPFNVKEAV